MEPPHTSSTEGWKKTQRLSRWVSVLRAHVRELDKSTGYLNMSKERGRGWERERERETLIRPAGNAELYISCVVSSSSSSSKALTLLLVSSFPLELNKLLDEQFVHVEVIGLPEEYTPKKQWYTMICKCHARKWSWVNWVTLHAVLIWLGQRTFAILCGMG